MTTTEHIKGKYYQTSVLLKKRPIRYNLYMQKIILYYVFAPLSDPRAVQLWQKNLAYGLNIKGRVIVSAQGINATLGGDARDLKAYIKETKGYLPFKRAVFKWSDGTSNDFPRLSVKLRDELVSFGVVKRISVNSKGVVGTGKRISPEDLHDLVDRKPNDVVFVDGRNMIEAAIGRFKNAVVFNVNHTRDFPNEITKSKYKPLKDKTMITYCTGGIRCEILSKLFIDAGYKDVYQLDGGIVSYLDKYKDAGLWEGSLYVFDRRQAIKASADAKTLGSCSYCGGPTERYINCSNQQCNELILACRKCAPKSRFCTGCLASAPAL